jgi:hypothetical protein
MLRKVDPAGDPDGKGKSNRVGGKDPDPGAKQAREILLRKR